jgi:hypothetical protein
MTPPYQRRDPQPISQGWEVPVAVIGGAALGVGLAALAGLGIASAVFGDGWVWPHGTTAIGHVLHGVLAGHPGRGLPAAQAGRVAGPAPVYACIAVCEAALIVTAVVAGVLLARYHRPGDARGGMASRSDAQHVLGVATLRGAKEIIRPDLYGPTASEQRR